MLFDHGAGNRRSRGSLRVSKQQQLGKLVEARKEPFKHYKRLGDYPGFECDYVSPYSKGAYNLDPDVMILLQDWSSDEALARSEGPTDLGRDPELPTNRSLDELLGSSFGMKLADTYATNLFPYIKPGGLSSRIPFGDLVYAAKRFALPQIRIVAPQVVVCLGGNTFNALRVAAGLTRCRGMASAIESPFDIALEEGRKATAWAQAHPGAWGQRNRNREHPGRTFEDWKRMSEAAGLDRRQ
jgi:restriction system protein